LILGGCAIYQGPDGVRLEFIQMKA
jgi:hypothetical protein